MCVKVNTDLYNLKLKVARHQLGMALKLFIEDADPISIHSLACGAAEILDSLCNAQQKDTFYKISAFPEVTKINFNTARNKYWNAFKHINDKSGNLRDGDVDLMNNFSDNVNDWVLYTAWYDYMQLIRALPIEAQVFQVWFHALNFNKLDPNFDNSAYKSFFPNLTAKMRKEQKLDLLNVVKEYINDQELLNDPKTEKDSLGLNL